MLILCNSNEYEFFLRKERPRVNLFDTAEDILQAENEDVEMIL